MVCATFPTPPPNSWIQVYLIVVSKICGCTKRGIHVILYSATVISNVLCSLPPLCLLFMNVCFTSFGRCILFPYYLLVIRKSFGEERYINRKQSQHPYKRQEEKQFKVGLYGGDAFNFGRSISRSNMMFLSHDVLNHILDLVQHECKSSWYKGERTKNIIQKYFKFVKRYKQLTNSHRIAFFFNIYIHIMIYIVIEKQVLYLIRQRLAQNCGEILSFKSSIYNTMSFFHFFIKIN